MSAIIQKEEIQKRRHEIAEVRHADSVYRDIVARRNERDDYAKRWFWELLQNAKDSVDDGETIKVKIEINEEQISFSHTGNPFELDDILSLIIQGSSKNNKEGKTGRFGTGFMTTYLLSKEVHISGKLNKGQGCFSFLLNRNANDNEDFFRLQQESNKAFDSSISENSYLVDAEFQTKFVYSLDKEGKDTAKVGLKCLDQLIPITQLFNDKIESVIVIENGITKTFSKSHIQEYKHDGNIINEWEVNTVIDKKNNSSFRAYIQKEEKYEACVITHFLNGTETVFQLTENYPRLYYTFPLIGTEEIGLPVIVNSTFFEPRVERDGIYLKKNSDNSNEVLNKEIINDALLNCLNSFAGLFTNKKVNGVFELFNFKLSKDLKWIDHDWLIKIKSETIVKLSEKPVIKSHHLESSYTSLNELIIPYANDLNESKELWQLLYNIKEIKVPFEEDLSNWLTVVKNIAKILTENNDPFILNFVWGIREVIDYTEGRETVETLQSSLDIDACSWLNKLYLLIGQVVSSFPLEKKIVLNESNYLRKAEGIYWDECNEDTLNHISDLVELNFAKKLVSRRINKFHISGVEDFTLQKGISEIKSKLNGFSEDDFNVPNLAEASAKFLRWAVDKQNNDLIRDLKILSGASKKADESYVYQYFPSTEHLLLSPKSFFKGKYPLYSSLVRDKDCLNEVYDTYLNIDVLYSKIFLGFEYETSCF